MLGERVSGFSLSLDRNMTQSADGAWEQIGVAAALAKTYAEDQREFLPLLAGLLEETIPHHQLVIERKPIKLFSSEKRVVSIELTLDEDVYVLQIARDGHRLEGSHRKIVRGITLKTESTPVQDWLALVGDRIQRLATTNERAYTALQNFLEFKNL
jgi:plasmid stability protein